MRAIADERFRISARHEDSLPLPACFARWLHAGDEVTSGAQPALAVIGANIVLNSTANWIEGLSMARAWRGNRGTH